MESSKTASAQEETALAETATQDASNQGPIWDRQLNRVKAAMWRHKQKGTVRYTIAIYRSYKDEKDGKWKNVHYFDRKDFQDIRVILDEADQKLTSLEGMKYQVKED